MPSSRFERPLLLILFFLSGAAALVYEVLWLKELGLLFGNTAYAAATTLAVFFLGMAAGSWAFGKRAAALDRPLRTYALLEVGIAGSALLYFALTPAFRWVWGALYPVLGGHLALLTAAKLLLATGILFLPAFFMGGTLPVMGQHLIRRADELGRTGTLLYLTNTVGAATGALLAGFVLPVAFGFRISYFLAIALNLAIALAAWGMSRAAPAAAPAGADPEAERGRTPAHEADAGAPPPAGGPGPILAIAFLSGFLVLGLEVLWTRMFAQVLHNSVYSFTAILVTFLVALALGSGIANALCRWRSASPDRVLLALSLLSWVFVLLSPRLFVSMTSGLQDVSPKEGWASYLVRIGQLATAVMLVPGVIVGTIYPYLLKASERFGSAPGRTIGRLAATNSVGGILGSLAAGFVLLGATGLWSSVQLLAAGYLAIAGIVGTRAVRGPGARIGYALAAVAVGFALPRVALPELPVVSIDAEAGERILETWEGRHGTVAVMATADDRFLKVDNHYSLGGVKAFASEQRQTQIPMFVLPEPKTVFYLGMGTGITAGSALDFPIDRVVTCELVPEVVEAARGYFDDWTNDLFRDPRSVVVVEDGRHFLTGTRERFDVIFSDLFVPWRAGVGALYSREHFEICRSRLADGGHFVLWVPLCQLSRAEFDVIARTVLEVFPHVTAWRGEFIPVWPTLGLVGSMEPQRLDPAMARRNLAHVIPDRAPHRITESDVLPYLMYAGNLGASRALFAGARLNTDDRPVIEYEAPKTQQRAAGRQVAWLTDDALLELIADLAEETAPENDPYLSQLGATELAYVRAGRMLYEVGVRVHQEKIAEAAPLYREFLAVVPFDIFPGLASR